MERHKDFEAALEAYMEMQRPIYKIPTDLGINAFKREAKAAGLPKSFVNKLVKAYKKRSWMEYRGVARYRGSFPTHTRHGNKIEVESEESEVAISVNQPKGGLNVNYKQA